MDPCIRFVEATVGGRVVRCERQARWRPAWFIDVELDGEVLPLYWRGDRGRDVSHTSPLRREADVLRVLEAEGVPVPHVYGYCDDPDGILMSRVPGSVEFHNAPVDEQARVAEDFLRALARWHAIDVSRLPLRPRDDLERWERPYRAVRPFRAAPLVEFALGWLRRNAPPPVREVLVQGDTGPGQFLFADGRVTAVIDWEFCHLGDPMEDLALIRARALSYPFGDLRERFARYAELSGNPVDVDRIRYHSVKAMLTTPMGLHRVLAARPRGIDWAITLAWNAVYSRAVTECLAEASGVALDRVDLPDGVPTPRAWLHDVVVDELGGVVPDDSFDAYRLRTVALLADHLRLADRLGPAFDAAHLEDAAALTGRRWVSRDEADAAVQDVVLSSGPDRDAELIAYLHRSAVRNEALLRPLMGELAQTAVLSPVG